MTTLEAIPEPERAWETGELGRSCDDVEVASREVKDEIEAALGMQMISIRLQKQLIRELKLVADFRGIGYQPLIRDVLRRFARAEIMQIASEVQKLRQAKEEIESSDCPEPPSAIRA